LLIIDKNATLSRPLWPTNLLLYDGFCFVSCCFLLK